MFKWLEFLTYGEGKLHDKQAQKEAGAENKKQQQNTNQQYGGYGGQIQTGQSRSQDQYTTGVNRGNELWGSYGNLAATGGVNPNIANRMIGVSGTNTGRGSYSQPTPTIGGIGGTRPTPTSGGDWHTMGSGGGFQTQGPARGNVFSGGGSQTSPDNSVDTSGMHPVDAIFARYGKSDTGSGTGNTDAGYWKQKYDSTGDKYYLERLESDFQGNGIDSAGGGFAPDTGGFNGEAFNEMSPYAKDLAATGGVSMDRLLATTGDYRGIADNPFDTARRGRIEGDIGNYRSMEATGGLSDADKNNYLGNGVFKNFSETGGFSPEQQNLYRQRATAAVPAMYQQMADDMARRRNVQGGYSPGFSNSQALLAKQGSQSMNDATRGAEADLQGQIRANMFSGAQGLSQGQHAFSGLQTGNRLAATQGAVGGEMNLEDAINRYKMNALNALTQENQFAEQLAQQGKIAGTGFLTAKGQSLTNAGVSMADIGAQNQRYMSGLQQQGQIAGLQGQGGLYGTNVNQGSGYFGQAGSDLSNQAGANIGYGGLNQENANRRGINWGNVARGVGAGIGTAAMFM